MHFQTTMRLKDGLMNELMEGRKRRNRRKKKAKIKIDNSDRGTTQSDYATAEPIRRNSPPSNANSEILANVRMT
jgi:hypothetical protein